MARLLIPLVVLTIAATAPHAWAQTTSASPWQHGTLLSAFVGASHADSTTAAVTGVGLGWEVTKYVGIEGRGAWFHPGAGRSDFTALLLPRLSFLPARAANPFVAAGVGMYRASFDSVVDTMPPFYRRRIDDAGVRGRTFEDTMLVAGGGVDLFASGHVAFRPEVIVQFVRGGSDTRVVPVFGVHVEYHFESRQRSPSMR